MPDPIATYTRPNGEKVIASKDQFKGKDMFSVRVYYQDANNIAGGFSPGRNGINLTIAEADEFLKLVVALFPEKVSLRRSDA